MKLSILICSIPERLSQLSKLTEGLTHKDVEVIYLGDNLEMTVGEKRNWLLKISHGDYVVFIDDDDEVSDNYIEKILEATEQETDCVCFGVKIWHRNKWKDVDYSIKYKMDANFGDRFLRMPNHIMAVKRELALDAMFPKMVAYEDAAYAGRLKLKTETKISDVLYLYTPGKSWKRNRHYENWFNRNR